MAGRVFSEFYNANKDDRDVIKYANEVIFRDLLVKNVKGEDKIHNLGDTCYEMFFNDIAPVSYGNIYTFKYAKEDTNGPKSFIDYIPLVLMISLDKNFMWGINFNLIPNVIRARLLDMLAEIDMTIWTNSDIGMMTNVLNKIRNFFLTHDIKYKDDAVTLTNMMNSYTGYTVSKAIRKYDITKINNIRMLEYCNWKYIPFYYNENAIKNASLSTIQKEIVKPI